MGIVEVLFVILIVVRFYLCVLFITQQLIKCNYFYFVRTSPQLFRFKVKLIYDFICNKKLNDVRFPS